MPPHRERRWLGITAGYAVLLAALAAVTALAYETAAPAYRPQMIRLAVLLAIAVAVIHILRRWRGNLRSEYSRFEEALRRQPMPPKVDVAFLRSREAVASGVKSQSYFEKILWPRLWVLSRARGDPAEIPLPARRKWLGRGPSRQAVTALITHVEDARAERR